MSASWSDNAAAMPPIEFTNARAIDGEDPIFASFRAEYPGFDAWLEKCENEQRPTWVIRDESIRRLAAVCIVKPNDDDVKLGGPTLKICSFKVDEAHQHQGLGELLLQEVLDYVDQHGYAYTYVTMFANHASLEAMLKHHGFSLYPERTALGEEILVRELV
jgi:GNAT superfamily N-acetyltransferase